MYKVAKALLCFDKTECSKDNDFKLWYYLKATPFLYKNVGFRKTLHKIYFADGL